MNADAFQVQVCQICLGEHEWRCWYSDFQSCAPCARSFNLDTLSLTGETYAVPVVPDSRRQHGDSVCQAPILFLFSPWPRSSLHLRVPAAGQFQDAVYYKLGNRQRPFKVVTADFNNDGSLDLACADWLSGHVTILLGNGDGTFQKPKNFPDPSPLTMAVGDFDEDGNLDLA